MTSLWRKLRWEYIRNNQQSVSFTIIYLLCILIPGFSRFLAYSKFNYYLALARACGQMLNISLLFSTIFVCRNFITSTLRSLGLAPYAPLDHYIYFHKLTGWLIAFFSFFHTLGHLLNMFEISKVTTIDYYQLLFSPYLGIGWILGLACLSGWLLCVVLLIILIFSMNFIRRRGCFEIFYYTHLLYIPFFIACFVHAPKFIYFICGPLCLFIAERGLRYYRSHGSHHGRTYVMEGSLLPSRVIRLVVRKPQDFTFNSGDFVYVNVPFITKREWHPITISSAPEDDFITLHIRAVGEWTNRLYDHFDRAQTTSIKDFIKNWQEPVVINLHPSSPEDCINLRTDADESRPESLDVRIEAIKNDHLATRTLILPIPDDCDHSGCPSKKWIRESKKDESGFEMIPLNKTNNNNVLTENLEDKSVPLIKRLKSLVSAGLNNTVILNEPLNICMDGPFGAPSSNIFETEHAILISTGIGVTPFASILQSIMHRYTELKKCCPKCSHIWTEKVLSQSVMKLRKVDFVWINRDHSSFEWFIEKLEHLLEQQLSVPGAKEHTDKFLDVHLYVTGQSTITTHGYVKCFPGRPNWDSLFQRIRQRNHGKITVFYCGRSDLATTVSTLCNKFNFKFKKEVF